ncbi:glucose-6-phosphate isomerase [Candidatus Parvarchaeota archaeon]|nr:glucose-6-phosphate isomerase [Candidatus Parvarchaeota archaeon]
MGDKIEVVELNPRLARLDFDERSNRLFSGGTEIVPSVRRLSEMKDVLFNKNFINRKNQNDVLYYMYRNAGVDKNPTVFQAHTIRYDVTAIMDYDLGGEFNKTLGHYHPIAENGLSYPELYEVLYGEVMYLLQKKQDDGSYDVMLIRAKKGDKVIMPPNYGHISINIGKSVLIEANLVNSTFKSDYKSISSMGGGAVYVTNNKDVIINKAYSGKVSITYKDAAKPGFLGEGSIYDEYVSHPEHFRFLNRPDFLLWKHDEWEIESQSF